ncbi:hypothetical protein LEP1GSC060_1647 [Leptospira weilii serovar Ranarum str. ICFT]|uniref:Uncharacterized protein n=1 Tax=Leptospira weilii serovar Ranarum str. ICFT TaxID=1218598 RepID=N1W7W8_9LEPT|nr:hypothetical protein LEP1GSC060_1647 [Leptospira weilii serovar Ranarum str. ICFT]
MKSVIKIFSLLKLFDPTGQGFSIRNEAPRIFSSRSPKEKRFNRLTRIRWVRD